MTDCIYTGAYIKVLNYDFAVAADIYRADDCLVIRMNGEECFDYRKDLDSLITHELHLPTRESLYFWRPDIGIAVVPLDACPRTANARPVLENK